MAGSAVRLHEATDPAALRDGYGVLDLYTRWQPFADRGLSLNAGVENVFDTDYQTVAGYGTAGRSVFGGIRAKM